MTLVAIILIREPDNWFAWRGTRYTLTPGYYTLDGCRAAINAAQSGVLLDGLGGDERLTRVLPLDSGDAWTLDAGRGILYFLGLNNKTSDANNPGGAPVAVVGDIAPATWWGTATLRRAWGMQRKWTSAHNLRHTGGVLSGAPRAEDLLIVSIEHGEEGLWCRFLDQVAAGRIAVDSTAYFLLDDSVTLERKDGKLACELALVEV